MITRMIRTIDRWIMMRGEVPERYEADYGMDKDKLKEMVKRILINSDAFFSPRIPCPEYRYSDETGELSFESPMRTLYKVNNTVHALFYHAGDDKAVILLPYRGGDIQTMKPLGSILAKVRISSLILLPPFHGRRTPEGTISGELFTSANIKGTIDAFRQAVMEVCWATDWLRMKGFSKIGIVGISLGGIIAALSIAHRRDFKAACLCLSGADLAMVAFRGIATEGIKRAFEKAGISEEEVRLYWRSIDPASYAHKIGNTAVLLISALYDPVFPLETQRKLYLSLKRKGVDLRLVFLPCGHYSCKYLIPKLLIIWSLITFLKTRL